MSVNLYSPFSDAPLIIVKLSQKFNKAAEVLRSSGISLVDRRRMNSRKSTLCTNSLQLVTSDVCRYLFSPAENNNQELWRPEQVLIVDNDSSSPPLNYDDGQCAICLGRSGSSRQETRHSLWSRFLFEMSHPVVPNQIGMSDLHNYFIEFYCIIIIIENLILLLGK